MSSARLIRPVSARRAAAVSAGALALCLSAAGTSYADTLPPPLPSPDSVITTLDQTVTSVTGTDPGLAPASGSGAPTGTAPAPAAPTTTTQTTKTTKQPASSPTIVTRHAPRPAARAAAPATQSTTVAWTAPADPAALSLPPATTVAAQSGNAPAVAPLLIPPVTQRIAPAAAMIEADKHSGSPMRGIMLTLAIAAALALGYEHGRLARQGALG